MAGIKVFSGRFLRVQTPLTIDGKQLKYNEGQPMYKTSFLPFSAKRELERANAKRPTHLRHKIEVLEGEPQVAKR